MNKATAIRIYPFFLSIVLILLGVGCKKGETSIKKDPIITWANPADIPYGTLVGTAQLNATANMPGRFTYVPALETKLSSGADQVLTAYFTPADETNYNALTKTVRINVLPMDIGNTTWDVLIYHATGSWHADVTFYADGTTKYDEPSDPGAYTSYGTWTLIDDKIHFGIGLDPNYVFDGIITDNTMSGTYKNGADIKTWRAVKKQPK